MSNPESVSEHLKLQPVAEGAYAAIATAEGRAFSTAGIIDLGDRTLVFDTFQSPLAGADLKRAAIELTGRPVEMVLISHWHSDHWLGNQVFAGEADIISDPITRDRILEECKVWLEMKADPSELIDSIASDEQLLEGDEDLARRAELLTAIEKRKKTLETLATLEPTAPNLTFETEMVFEGPKRSVTLRTKGAGHTESDSYLLLEAEKVAFLADLGFFETEPFLFSADPPAWIAQLEAMQEWAIDVFVPGHGPVGGKENLRELREYIEQLVALVDDFAQEGGSLEGALQLEMPERYASWLPEGRGRLEANIEVLYKRASS